MDRHAEGIDLQRGQGHGPERVGGHLAAHRHRPARGVGRRHHVVDQPQQARMQRHRPGPPPAGRRGRGPGPRRSDRWCPGRRTTPARPTSPPAAPPPPPRSSRPAARRRRTSSPSRASPARAWATVSSTKSSTSRPRHQRHEDAHRPQRRRPQDGPHLLAEQLLQRRRFQHQPPVERPAGRRAQVRVGRQLVRPQVEGADAHRPAGQLVQQLAIDADLLLLGRQRPPGQEQELAAIQADAADAQLDGRLRLVTAG